MSGPLRAVFTLIILQPKTKYAKPLCKFSTHREKPYAGLENRQSALRSDDKIIYKNSNDKKIQ